MAYALPAKRAFPGPEGAGQRPPKQPALAASYEVPSDALFGGLDRQSFTRTRVHNKLHAQVVVLSDVDLDQLGKLGFNQQFPHLEVLLQQAHQNGAGVFGGASREEYTQSRIHRKLHAQAAGLSDEQLFELGRLSFNQQFIAFETQQFVPQSAPAAASTSGSPILGMPRETYVQQRVHRKLHTKAATLSDQELLEMGKLNFNEQFTVFEQFADFEDGAVEDSVGEGLNQPTSRPVAATIPQPMSQSGDIFGGQGRAGYMQARVHRKLHHLAESLSDQELLELGQRTFNDQFPTIERMMPGAQVDNAPHSPSSTAGAAAGKGGPPLQREGDWICSLCGDLQFARNVACRRCGAARPDASPPSGKAAGKVAGKAAGSLTIQGANYFGGLGREGYMQQRIHRKLHARVASWGEKELYELGQSSFNDQFPFVEGPEVQGSRPASSQQPVAQAHARPPVQDVRGLQAVPTVDIFGGIGREAYMQQRVHRRLHEKAACLADEELLELGRRGFKDQFPVFDGLAEPTPQTAAAAPAAAQPASVDMFGGIGRDAYMQQRVHRKLHSHAAGLTDQGLLDLGRLPFKEQFPLLGQDARDLEFEAAAAGNPSDLFGGIGRDAYVQQRIHRKLHGYAAGLDDQDVADFGRMTFNDQFKMLEQISHPSAPAQPAQPAQHQRHPQGHPAQAPNGNSIFGGLTRTEYMQQRVHRRLHPKAISFSDQELLELGRLTFNEQFPLMEQFDEIGNPAPMQPAHLGAPHAAGAPQSDMFDGIGRDAYVLRSIHRRLHPQLANFSDQEIADLGRLKFNDQFPAVERKTMEGGSGGGSGFHDPSDIFGGLGRDGYIAQRIHRKLHAQISQMSDQEICEFGRLGFNQQFLSLGHPVAGAAAGP